MVKKWQPKKSTGSPDKPTLCSCKYRTHWVIKHDAQCDLWLNQQYADGMLDWDPDTQSLTDNFGFDDMTTVVSRAKAKCVCIPSKKWLCTTCGVKRDEEWHEWEWDLNPNDWKKSNWDTTPYVPKDRHCMSELIFPNGVKVHGSSLNKYDLNNQPDFGVYLSTGWLPLCLGFTIPWTDFGMPKISWDQVIHAAREAYSLAEQGWKVEVGCMGGHGRTGTFLAYLAVLSGVPAQDAVAYVRTNYCEHAIESDEQEFSVIQFDARINEQPVPGFVKKPFEIKNSKGNKSMTVYKGTITSQKELF